MFEDKRGYQGFPGGFTVLMAVYGKDDPKLFTKALASVFDNDLKPDHMVLVVDGPVHGAIDLRVMAAGIDCASTRQKRGPCDSPERWTGAYSNSVDGEGGRG
jgi:hypothetical protein